MNKSTENGRAASLAVATGSAFDPRKPYPTPWQIKGTLDGSPLIKDARGISVGTLDDASQQAVNGVRDTDRLDWMIAHSAFLSHSRDGEVCNVWFSQDPEDDSNGAVPADGYPQKCYYDAREAIDAAMRGPNIEDEQRATSAER